MSTSHRCKLVTFETAYRFTDEKMNRLSRIFRPFNTPPKNNKLIKKLIEEKEPSSKGYKLMKNYGLIQHFAPGMYHILPMGQRIVEKLIRVISREMKSIGAERMSAPLLTMQHLWETTNTYEKMKEELYHVKARNESCYLLSPTHEQTFSNLISNQLLSYREFPKLLYQIGPKFRDEHRPKLGLLRSKEFLMKDLYSFDVSEESANETYEKVTKAYEKIFQILGIPVHRVESNSTNDCKKSHEYHYFNEVGDDKLYLCPSCNEATTASVMKNRNSCPNCSLYTKESQFVRGIEVAHTFSFGTYYSERLLSGYVSKDCRRNPLYMCSYGIGITRLLSAIPEMLATENNELRWPLAIAPYLICIILPKEGSREYLEVELQLPELYQLLETIPSLRDEIVIDDRCDWTIGKRFMEANLFGFPFIVVAGKDATHRTPLFELHDLLQKTHYLMPKSSLMQYLINRTEGLLEERKKFGYLVNT